jgi:hypothetical protein
MTDEPQVLTIPVPLTRPFGTPVTLEGVEMVWDAFVMPHQDDPPSIEMRCLMAILRAVYEGMRTDV